MSRDIDGKRILDRTEAELKDLSAEYREKLEAYEDSFENEDDYMLEFDMDEVTEDYLSDIFDALADNVSLIAGDGLRKEAFEMVVDAYTEYDLDDIDMYSETIYSNMMDLLESVVDKTKDLEERIDMYEYLYERLEDGLVPESLVITVQDVLHDLFNDREILEMLAEHYMALWTVSEDPEAPFIKGRMHDVVERLGWPKGYMDEYNNMQAYDENVSYLIYADCLSRRGDRRVLDVWKNFLKTAKKNGAENYDEMEDYIKFRRTIFLDTWGNDDEKESSISEYVGDDEDLFEEF